MYLIHTTPLARALKTDHLSYFSARAYPEGSIISVPLRGKSTPALVLASERAADAKARVRSAQFTTKKIDEQEPDHLFQPAFIRAASAGADYFATHIGSVLAAVVPNAILEAYDQLTTPAPNDTIDEETENERLAFQAPDAERIDRYRSIIREEFARKHSVHIVVPSIQDAERIEANLRRGVEQYTYVLTGAKTKKQQRELWAAALAQTHPVLLITTGTFLSLPRADVGTRIVEHETARAYKQQQRPFVDYRTLAEFLSREDKARLIFADMPLRVGTRFRHERGELDEVTPLKSRLPTAIKTSEVDMRTKQDETEPQKKKQPFTILSEDLTTALAEAATGSAHAFCYVTRRGLAPLTVCEDCGTSVSCHACSAGVVLHKGQKENMFVCHACGATRSAHKRCKTCTSWKLTTLGIGIERVADVLKETYPDAPIHIMERESVRTHKQAQQCIERFEKEGGILLGTEMALPYLPETVPTIGIVSLDTLLSLPDWNAYERLFDLLIQLRERAGKTLVVQTRRPGTPVVAQALEGAIMDFYRAEIQTREEFGYPPYTTLIRLSTTGTQKRVMINMSELEEALAEDGFLAYAPAMHIGKNKYRAHGLIRLPHEKWPNEKLLAKLRSLPPQIEIVVAPEHLM